MVKKIIAGATLFVLALSSVAMESASFVASAGMPTSAARTRAHACCPDVRGNVSMFSEFVPGSVPCGNEHPCCAKQSPVNPTSLPPVTRTPRPDPSGHVAQVVDKNQLGGSTGARLASINFFPPLPARSTVLRI
jgi:hypothetical protein